MIRNQNGGRLRITSICLCVIALLLSSLFVPAASADESSDAQTGSGENVELIETGIVLNPEALVNAGSATSDEPEHVTTTTDTLELQPTWQRSNQSARSTSLTSRALPPFIGPSVCDSTNSSYKVISKVGGEKGSGYVYDCYMGSGTYTSATAFPTYGGGVTAVCPGNNKGQIYYRATWGGDWFWSRVRGPETSGSTCYYFDALMMYKTVKLNAGL